MTFTYDVTTTNGQMRLLLGDTTQPSNFSDEELTALFNLTMFQLGGPSQFQGSGTVSQNEVLFFACAAALDALAARVASSGNGQSIKIGDWQITGKDQVDSIKEMADRFRDAINNIPAWGIVEENNCGFNELTIIRNWVLRTEM